MPHSRPSTMIGTPIVGRSPADTIAAAMLPSSGV
jgi:hypothetical protein